MPNIGNGNVMYIQGCGTHNTGYSIAIAPNGVGGIRVYTANNGAFSDLGNTILVNTTYKYTYYSANNNPWGLNYGLPSWKVEILSNNMVPYNTSINLHLLYTNNNQSVTGYCDMQLNTVQAGSQIRFRDINGYLKYNTIANSRFFIFYY